MITEENLPPEEMRKILEGCAVVMIATVAIFLAYFVYLMHNSILTPESPISLFLLIIALPAMLSFGLAGIITFELLYHRKIRKPLQFHLKRAFGQIALFLIGIVPAAVLIELFDRFLSPYFGRGIFLLGPFVWVWVFVIIVFKFRKFIRKLGNGAW
jgi:hypothetical protein